MNMGKLDGRGAVITGVVKARTGPHGHARRERSGADIAIRDICAEIVTPYPNSSMQDLEEAGTLVEKTGRRCVTAVIDICDFQQLHAFAGAVIAQLGGLEILCVNTGIPNTGPSSSYRRSGAR